MRLFYLSGQSELFINTKTDTSVQLKMFIPIDSSDAIHFTIIKKCHKRGGFWVQNASIDRLRKTPARTLST